jgi:type I restriction enzyme M protein
VDFAARRASAREEMQPLLDGAAKLKAEVVDRNQPRFFGPRIT